MRCLVLKCVLKSHSVWRFAKPSTAVTLPCPVLILTRRMVRCDCSVCFYASPVLLPSVVLYEASTDQRRTRDGQHTSPIVTPSAVLICPARTLYLHLVRYPLQTQRVGYMRCPVVAYRARVHPCT
eukprot:99682-Rhodomonas_salina.1